MALLCVLAVAATTIGVVAPASARGAVIRSTTVTATGHAAPEKKKHAHKHRRPKQKQKPERPVWSPKDNTTFNYPFSPHRKDRFRIRHHIYEAVKAAPAGSSIRLATFTYVDKRLTRALLAAHRRGVSVQVLVNDADVDKSPPYHRLRKVLGYSVHGTPRTTRARASFARTCQRSCRGTGGNLHSKIYLFSQVGHTRWVSMVGSANLNKFAAVGQWNHLNTITGRATYVQLRHVFNQMRRDRPVRHPFQRFTTPKTVTWVYPKPHTTASNDPMIRILSRIDCRATAHTGRKVEPKPVPKHKSHKRHKKRHKHKSHVSKAPVPKPITRRTVIRIAMYAWFDQRGDALAKAVRQKWDQGCDVRVIYSVLNRKVKRILYDPSGRGRIPMRRSIVHDGFGTMLDYNHSKYVEVNGRFAGRGRRLVWTGSMNFTHLGLVSDDIVIRLSGRKVYFAYLANFRRVWHAPTSRKPKPTRPRVRARA